MVLASNSAWVTVIPSASTSEVTGAATALGGELEDKLVDELVGAFATVHEASKSIAKGIKTHLEFEILIAAF